MNQFVPTRRPIKLDSSPLVSNQAPKKIEPLPENPIPTLSPLEDEEGPFEYVYYYEYEYDEEVPLTPEPAPVISTPDKKPEIPKSTFNFQTKIPTLSDVSPTEPPTVEPTAPTYGKK